MFLDEFLDEFFDELFYQTENLGISEELKSDIEEYIKYIDIDSSPEEDIPEPAVDDDIPEDTAPPHYEPYDNFDPDEVDPSDVVGNPEEAMDNWHRQETSCSCAVASQQFVLEYLTGKEFEESELRDLAEENGWYSDNGTPRSDVGNILDYMGLQVEQSQGNSIEDLEEGLASGHGMIVSVDSSELWSGNSDDQFGPGSGSDHSVQVIGIDYSDPENPKVILNDSGRDSGCGATVPLDEFMEAWEDSGYFMVEAYA